MVFHRSGIDEGAEVKTVEETVEKTRKKVRSKMGENAEELEPRLERVAYEGVSEGVKKRLAKEMMEVYRLKAVTREDLKELPKQGNTSLPKKP